MTNAKTSSLTGLKQRRIIGKVAFYVLGLLMAIIVCIPFYWMIITSLKGRGAIMSIPVEWIPKEPTLDAYKKLFAMPEFVGSIFNSFYVSVLCTAVRLLCAAMAAFALTKIPFKGRNAVFGIYVTALMIPSQITFIPLFIIMTNMHLTNSLNAFMLLQLFNAFAIFMMRQKMMTINDAYIEAAVIDGASMWRIFFKIILPMSGSAMATLAILAFMEKQIYASTATEHVVRPVQESVQPDNGRRTDFDYSDSDRLYFCAEVFQRRPYGWRRERIKVYD